ncbi:MAG: inorganic pyrophosphatase [Candidatus Vogelbacteria bacterium RIFOXYD1_FULL_44_32]|uniref:Inorganic pyrophosphatase n=1 Tax=Candidatus Vogelbacteria bacterium RIFOXYD1_FULL_44_32 TaxID=1802438 RepID=A0A1G2QFK8_9BACT|nr:MAG: inorganic pyrophosphatase [Candidatus Vogelbacteria bacterium RIFOXYD1_FULL_44_32]
MNLWHDIPAGDASALNVIIEIPKLSRIKYELDKETGLIGVDRVLYSPMHYPANYGFVPQTLWDDGDPLDVLVMSHEPFVPGCLVKVRPVGVMEMTDDGDSDAKVLSVPAKDPRYNSIQNLTDIDPHTLEEIKHFFKVYKDLQKKEVVVADWRDKSEATKDIQHSFDLYQKKYPKN